ncbi:MAG: inositol-3-phosphate synthase [Actinomycetota bacterium]
MTAPLGVWLLGARGAVATTTLVGAAAARRGLTGTTGMVTEREPVASAPTCPVASMVFGGHDVRDTPLREAALALTGGAGPLDPGLVRAVEGDLADAEGHLRPAPPAGGSARAFVQAVQRDLEAFAEATGARRTVVVNVASTEPPPAAHPAHDDLPALEALIDRGSGPGPALPASLLYAYAAIDAGLPYVNFTPSVGASVPALEELARERRVPHAGRDGKTGETLLKSALAPMFASRNLRVRSWSGVNMLGNGDGRTLSDPAAAASKTQGKARVVPDILGYEPHTLVRIDYVPSLGDWKTAWDLIQFEGFLGTPMSLQLTWQGSDSALAAPLVLDLVRLVDLAAERGEAGALGHLAFFFKAPLGSDTHDLAAQYAQLAEHVLC